MSTKDSPSGIVRSYYRGIETDLTLQQLEQLYKELEAYFLTEMQCRRKNYHIQLNRGFQNGTPYKKSHLFGWLFCYLGVAIL